MPAQLHQRTHLFLGKLKKNNNRVWFDKHKPEYEKIRNDFIVFISELIKELNKIDRTIGDLEAAKCVYRIYRDLRFSKNKTPYKVHLSANIQKGGRKSKFAGYYIHIEPGGNSFFGGGIWHPEPEELNKIRQEIDYNFNEYKKIVEKKSFIKMFKEPYDDKLKKNPQSYTEDNPAIEYLKYKSFIYGADYISDKTVTGPDFLKEILKMAKELSPFILFLNRAID